MNIGLAIYQLLAKTKHNQSYVSFSCIKNLRVWICRMQCLLLLMFIFCCCLFFAQAAHPFTCMYTISGRRAVCRTFLRTLGQGDVITIHAIYDNISLYFSLHNIIVVMTILTNQLTNQNITASSFKYSEAIWI